MEPLIEDIRFALLIAFFSRSNEKNLFEQFTSRAHCVFLLFFIQDLCNIIVL